MTTGQDAADHGLSHIDAEGRARMVDVSTKAVTAREAVAEARVHMSSDTLARLQRADLPKGDVLGVARIAGIQAAKRTGELIPLCHPLALDVAEIDFELDPPEGLVIRAVCRTTARTGVEMEAMTAASIAALTVYDMCKAVEKGITIGAVQLVSKTGGKSGTWTRGASDSEPQA